jgi:hypothetical protein
LGEKRRQYCCLFFVQINSPVSHDPIYTGDSGSARLEEIGVKKVMLALLLLVVAG